MTEQTRNVNYKWAIRYNDGDVVMVCDMFRNARIEVTEMNAICEKMGIPALYTYTRVYLRNGAIVAGTRKIG